MKIISEWFFDPIYDEQSKQLIHEGLNKLVSEWAEATCPKLDSRRQRGGASIAERFRLPGVKGLLIERDF